MAYYRQLIIANCICTSGGYRLMQDSVTYVLGLMAFCKSRAMISQLEHYVQSYHPKRLLSLSRPVMHSEQTSPGE